MILLQCFSTVDVGIIRVKGVKGASGVFEMSWASDGRATFQYGSELIKGQTHIIWRRIGTHDIFKRP